jgi:hypothetical protein
MEAEIAAWLGSVQNRAADAARRAQRPATEHVSVPVGIVSDSGLEIKEAVRQKSSYISNSKLYEQVMVQILDPSRREFGRSTRFSILGARARVAIKVWLR